MTRGALHRVATVTLALAAVTPVVATLPAGAQSGRPATVNPRSIAFSVVLEDQLLANLNFLPVAFVPASRPTPPTTTTSTSTTTLPATSTTTPSATTRTLSAPATRSHAVRITPATLQRGHYVWRFSDLPALFKSNWQVGALNVILRGALMRFQAQHNLAVTGNMDATTWLTLVVAALRHQRSDETYNVVIVQRALPQRVWLYRNGKDSFTTLANTGIAVAPTAPGTFTVYLRYVTTTMSGTLPDGKPYHDTGIPWTSYFNGGDALHGFIRSTYGWPQSLGCVEMPFATAKILWPFTPLGTLVTVE
jgi:lipoprotein-anchoring transpeptidase ErfK/SrfK